MREVDVSVGLAPRHHEVMRCLGLLTRGVHTDLWCLVGGMMVLVVAREAGRPDSRGERTKDGDSSTSWPRRTRSSAWLTS